jgi:hypothetical protein
MDIVFAFLFELGLLVSLLVSLLQFCHFLHTFFSAQSTSVGSQNNSITTKRNMTRTARSCFEKARRRETGSSESS